MRRLILALTAVFIVTAFVGPTAASAQQTVNVYVGGFVPKGFHDRDIDDVLYQDAKYLTFDLRDFNGVTAGAEWLVGLGNFFDAGFGVGIYSRSAPSVYTRLVNSNGREIDQDLRLRVVPVTATVRWVPFGHDVPVQPYLGAGVGIFAWRYTESGQFVTSTNRVFEDTFTGSGTATGPVVMGGVRFAVTDAASLGGEVRWQSAKGNLPASEDFAGSKIDLGGFNYLATFSIRF